MNDETLVKTAKKAGLIGIHQATSFDGQRPYWRLQFSDEGNAQARTEINSVHANEVAARLLRLQLVEPSEHPDAARWREQQERISEQMDRPMNNIQHSQLSGELSAHIEGTENLASYSVIDELFEITEE